MNLFFGNLLFPFPLRCELMRGQNFLKSMLKRRGSGDSVESRFERKTIEGPFNELLLQKNEIENLFASKSSN